MAVAHGTPGGVGSKLREARERKGITIRQIADTTKISSAFLEALERNDIKRLPGGIFSRSFVRTYAIEVGLPPEETIQEFIAQFPNDSVTAGRPTAAQHEDNENLESDRRLASAFIKLVAISVPIAGVVLYFGLSGRRAIEHHPEPSAAARSSEASTTSGGTADNRADEHFVLGVSANGRASVSATVDGQRTIERDMQAGEHWDVTVRRDVVLTASDAGAIAITLDGVEARSLGKSGESTTVRLNTANFKDYLASR